MYKYRSIGPNAALALLSLFMNKQHELTSDEFDYLFDALVEFLEKLNNERYRIWPDDPNLPDLTDGQE